LAEIGDSADADRDARGDSVDGEAHWVKPRGDEAALLPDEVLSPLVEALSLPMDFLCSGEAMASLGAVVMGWVLPGEVRASCF
jgi:hypothetical protein